MPDLTQHETEFLLQLIHNERSRYTMGDNEAAVAIRATCDMIAAKLTRSPDGKDAENKGEGLRAKDRYRYP